MSSWYLRSTAQQWMACIAQHGTPKMYCILVGAVWRPILYGRLDAAYPGKAWALAPCHQVITSRFMYLMIIRYTVHVQSIHRRTHACMTCRGPLGRALHVAAAPAGHGERRFGGLRRVVVVAWPGGRGGGGLLRPPSDGKGRAVWRHLLFVVPWPGLGLQCASSSKWVQQFNQLSPLPPPRSDLTVSDHQPCMWNEHRFPGPPFVVWHVGAMGWGVGLRCQHAK